MEDGGGCCLTSGSDLTTTTKRSRSGSDWPFPWYQALGELNALVYFRMISHPTLVTHFLETTEFKNLKIFFFSVFTVRTCGTRSKSPLWSPLWIGPMESLTLKLSSNFENVGFPAPVLAPEDISSAETCDSLCLPVSFQVSLCDLTSQKDLRRWLIFQLAQLFIC